MTNALPRVTIYTDGACEPNPGPGGWAAVMLRDGEDPVELGGGEPRTTNNQMELRAALEALQALPGPHEVTLLTDSQYLARGLTEWLPNWARRGWQPNAAVGLPNWELWRDLAAEAARHRVECRWVRAHAGDPWNERVDRLARSRIAPPPLPTGDAAAVHIFTAISVPPGDGPGAWAVLLTYRCHRRELADLVPDASAFRLHLLAAVAGLRALKAVRPVHLYSLSDYLVNGATRWLPGWRRRDWRTLAGTPVQNRDLWENLVAAAGPYRVRYHLTDPRDPPGPLRECLDLARSVARGRPGPGAPTDGRAAGRIG